MIIKNAPLYVLPDIRINIFTHSAVHFEHSQLYAIKNRNPTKIDVNLGPSHKTASVLTDTVKPKGISVISQNCAALS